MQLNVGLTTLIGQMSKYAERFDLLELRFEPEKLSAKALKRLRAGAPQDFIFSLLVPPALTSAGLANLESFAPVLEAAELLQARWIVLQTGPEVGPSPRVRTRLAALAAHLGTPTRRVAWEPRGPWEPEVAQVAARSYQLVLVEDLSMVDAPSSGVIYTRLRVPGPGAALRPSALERLGEQIAGADEAFVVIEGRGSGRARNLVEEAIAAAVLNAESEDDDLEEETIAAGNFQADDEADEPLDETDAEDDLEADDAAETDEDEDDDDDDLDEDDDDDADDDEDLVDEDDDDDADDDEQTDDGIDDDDDLDEDDADEDDADEDDADEEDDEPRGTH